MATSKDPFVQDLKNKCRCCFKRFKHSTESIELTKTIEKQIQEITNMQFKYSTLYPSSVCRSCSVVLKKTSTFRNGLIKRQEKLYYLINSDPENEKDQDNDYVKQEIEVIFTEPFNFNIKMEHDDKSNVILFEAPIIENSCPSPCQSSSLITTKVECFPMISTYESPSSFVKNEVASRRSSISSNKSSKESSSDESEYSKKHKKKCVTCGKFVLNLKNHQQRVHKPKPSKKCTLPKKCPYCGIECKNAQCTDLHVRQVHLKEKNCFCDICGFGAFQRNIMRHHMREHIDRKISQKVSCLHCPKVFYGHENRKVHVRRYHRNKSINECFCGNDFESLDKLIKHLKKIHNQSYEIDIASLTERSTKKGIGKKKCNMCDKHFRHLKQHQKICGLIPKVKVFKKYTLPKKCPYCGIECTTPEGTDLHVRQVHLKEKNCFCDICGFGAFQRSIMRKHMIKHIDKKIRRKFACLHCPKVFYSHSVRQIHVRRAHPDKGLNECFCGKDFESSDKMIEHLKNIHNQSDEFVIAAPTKKSTKEAIIKEKCNMCDRHFQQLKLHQKRCGLIPKVKVFKKYTLPKKCPYCGIKCTTPEGTDIHVRQVHLKEKNCFCDICGFGAFQRSIMRLHMMKHIDRKIRRKVACLHCPKVLYGHSIRKMHMRRAHLDKGINECFCGKDFESSDKMVEHLKNIHNQSDEVDIASLTKGSKKESKKKCIKCGKNYYRYNQHKQRCGLPRKVRVSKKNKDKNVCYMCGVVFSCTSSVSFHIRKVHLKEKRHFCDICGHGSFYKKEMIGHIRTHVNWKMNEIFSCIHCKFIFYTNTGLKDHHKTVHRDKKTNECFCGKIFYTTIQLKKHIDYEHTNSLPKIPRERTFICVTCNKGFFKKNFLINHMQLHENKIFTCEKCPKTFKVLRALAVHRKYHEEPRIKCDFENCDRKFYKPECLRTHKKVHLGQRDYPCHLCEKSYFKADPLNRHLLNYHKEPGYICEVPECTLKFAKKEYYRSHLNSQHKALLLLQKLLDNVQYIQREQN